MPAVITAVPASGEAPSGAEVNWMSWIVCAVGGSTVPTLMVTLSTTIWSGAPLMCTLRMNSPSAVSCVQVTVWVTSVQVLPTVA